MVTQLSSLLLAALLSLASTQSFAASASQPDNKSIPLAGPTQGAQTEYYNSYIHNFGSWPVGYTAIQDFTFTVYVPTRVFGVYTGGPSFTSVDNCPYYMSAYSSCTVRVFFRPWGVGYQSGQTQISTDQGMTEIQLIGYGY